MLNIFVAEIRLQCARVVAPVGQCVAARMAQHVRMHTALEPSLNASLSKENRYPEGLAALPNHVVSSRNERTHHRIGQATRLAHTRSAVPVLRLVDALGGEKR